MRRLVEENEPALRQRHLRRFREPLREHETVIAETFFVLAGISHTRRHLAQWMKKRRVGASFHSLPGRSWVLPQPLGVVGVVDPWNYPLQLALFARHLCARPARRAPHRGAAAQLPARGRRQGRLLLSASLADAGLLAVPHRVDGPGPDPGDLHGALPAVPGGARPGADREPQGVGVLRRRRDGRARIAGRDRHGGAREARQPGVRRQLQPAAPRRPGARQRQDHPGAGGRFPRRRLERDQADLGLVLGPAARARQGRACCCASWRKPSTASTRTSRPTTALSCASISSASTRRSWRWSRA